VPRSAGCCRRPSRLSACWPGEVVHRPHPAITVTRQPRAPNRRPDNLPQIRNGHRSRLPPSAGTTPRTQVRNEPCPHPGRTPNDHSEPSARPPQRTGTADQNGGTGRPARVQGRLRTVSRNSRATPGRPPNRHASRYLDLCGTTGADQLACPYRLSSSGSGQTVSAVGDTGCRTVFTGPRGTVPQADPSTGLIGTVGLWPTGQVAAAAPR
jgi:hypothetical protein